MSEVKAATHLAKIVHVGEEDRVESTFGPMEVVINRGLRQGLKQGDRFLVFGIGPRIVDPDTGEDLGELELVRGQGKIVHLQNDIATIRSIGRRRTRPAKRIIREADPHSLFDWNRKVIEEELSPEVEIPFEGVRLGDLAKPI